jgi:membrane-bound lytic murein transglycosylase D
VKGECLEKASRLLLLLSILLLLAGCGGLQTKANSDPLLLAPVPSSQDSISLSEGRVEEILFWPSGTAGDTKIRDQAELPIHSPTDIGFCYQEEPFPPTMAEAEEDSQSQPSKAEPPLFLSLGEDIANPELQAPLSEPSVSPEEAGEERIVPETLPPAPQRKIRTEEGEAYADAGKEEREKSEEPVETQTSFPSRFVAEFFDGLRPDPSAKETTLSSLPSAEESAEEPSSEVKGTSSLLAGLPGWINERVHEFIDFFQTRADTFFNNSLARSQAYESMMKKIFREKNLPEELFYLALIESGFNPKAQSPAKACGIWQFMAKTAKRFGLKIDKWVDERRDPEKATYAAAEYLKSLHEMFNCWYLATASYNAGEGKILEAMKRAGSQDFWEISQDRYLKRETQQYVPMFLAALAIAQDPQKYGFTHVDYQAPLSYEKVLVPPGTRLDRIARAAHTDIEEIRDLNLSLRRGKTPPSGGPFEIKLPPGKKEIFKRNFFKMAKFDLRTAKKHQVRRGETLGQIAHKHRVSLRQLCEVNQISPKTLLMPGVTLLVPR